MRHLFLFSLFFLISFLWADNSTNLSGGDIVGQNVSEVHSTLYWAGAVGWMNVSAPSNTNVSIGYLQADNATIYTVYTNGSYANNSLMVTRLPFRPAPGDLFAPSPNDFNETGMFSTFSMFSGWNWPMYLATLDGPRNTFCNPCVYSLCNISGMTIACPYIIMANYTVMGVLKFFNGTHSEPIFITTLAPQLGYNGSYFDFEYVIPRNESYYFYTYQECAIDSYVDGVATDYFPATGVPYELRLAVRQRGTATPIPNANISVVEKNGRNLLQPVPISGWNFFEKAYALGDSGGEAYFAVSPTRYNIPDSSGYDIYVEVASPVYCQKHLNITSYSSLSPTLRSSLVNDSYASQVKSAAQNMNALAATATKWVAAKKMRDIQVNVSTVNGSTTPAVLPVLKAGAPNRLNISAKNSSNDTVVTQMIIKETNGFMIAIPTQPDKSSYSNYVLMNSTETPVIIPTRYNNNANLTIYFYQNYAEFANLTFTVDSTLAPPAGTEADMDDTTYSLIASALQNINMVLANIGKSLSTV